MSFNSHLKFKYIIWKRHLFKEKNIGVSQNFPKAVNAERKRLQPLITALNNSGKKASLRITEVYVNGTKWDNEMVENELNKCNGNAKRQRSSPNVANAPKRKPANVNSLSKNSKYNVTNTPTTSSNMFPVFKLNSNNNVLAQAPGCSPNAKTYIYKAD